MLHNYLGNVLQAHRLIITSRGYMGLAPPETDVGDIVVAFGGPSVPFVVRDTTLRVSGKLVADDTNGHAEGDNVGRALSTEGHKVKMSQRKTPNAKRKTQKQPHMAPHPINFF